jgi:hypothetical protein
MERSLFERVIDLREVHPLKASYNTVLTDGGITYEVREAHPSKNELPISSKSGIVISTSDLQLKKVDIPYTQFAKGRYTDSSFEQLLKLAHGIKVNS